MLKHRRRKCAMAVIAGTCVMLSGCALLQLPFQAVNVVGNVAMTVLKTAFEIIKHTPTPPPGVF